MSIRKRKNKNGYSYQVRIRGVDNSWITKTFKTKREAVAFKTYTLNKINEGHVVSNILNKLTLSQYWNRWCNDCRTNTSEGWKKSQNQMFESYIKPVLGNFKLNQINGAQISRTLDFVRSMGRSEQTILHVYNLLRKLFNDAVEEYEILNKSPVKKAHRPKVPRKEAEFLDFEGLKALLNHVKGKPYELAIWLGSVCGLRVGEIQALRWDSIDFQNGWIKIKSTYARKEKAFRPYPKGKKWRNVPIPLELSELLKVKFQDKRSDFVVPQENSSDFMSYHSYYKYLKKYCKEIGISSKFATHNLRHSTSELYMEHGASRDDLRSLFAHSSNSVTDIYIHDKDRRSKKISSIAKGIKLFSD